MQRQNRKYSILIRPLAILLDLLIINGVVYYIADKEYLNVIFLSYTTIFWLLISFYTKFYNVYRYTHIIKLLKLLVSQFFIFLLAYLAYFSVFREGVVVNYQLVVFIAIIITISFFKFFYFFILKKYRSSGKNYRNVVVIGESVAAKNIAKLFNKRQDFGYHFFGFFSDKESKAENYLGNIKKGFGYILKNNIDEIYCEVSSISQIQIKKVREFANENHIEIRLIPETKGIYSKDYILEYYGTIPILKPKVLPFERIETHIIKRIFDVIFSLFICVSFLLWLIPILWIIIKIDSKGPLFFRQKRDGINGKQFYCYKIRSMKLGSQSDNFQATKNDNRITKVGMFLRKTSLDELPQFFNVLKGDMSIVGPRPHINIQTKKYLKAMENYIIRNSVKPGITGLAQISGYRGEIIKKSDIENRVRLDIFYIENWSFFLDIKIIIQTIFNVFKGEEKAY